VSSCSFILSSEYPSWDVVADLETFAKDLENARLVEAIVHVGYCENEDCRNVSKDVERFLFSNPAYFLVALSVLSQSQERVRRLRRRNRK
jgi:hypothetical protein